MLQHYATVALRRLRRQPASNAINVLGLAVGIACCLVIFLFVRNELAVNTVFADVDRIYRVGSDWQEENMGLRITTVAPAGETLVQEYPEVVDQVRLYLMSGDLRVESNGYRRDIMMADTSVLSVFDLPLVLGDPNTALSAPRSAVVTEELANEVFGTTDVLGEVVYLRTWQQGEQPYTITGVRRALPFNSVTYFGADDDEYDVIIPPHPFGDFFGEAGWTSWHSRYILQYVKLAPGASVDALRSNTERFIETHAPAELHGVLDIRFDPLRTLHLDDEDGAGWRTIKLLSVVAILILLLATINFTNLSTARSLTRAREIGVRKTMGALRGQLTLQFLSESVLMCFLSALIGAVMAALSIDKLFDFVGRERVLEHVWDPTTLGAIFLITVIAGVAAGLYPALILSSFRPARALKGRTTGAAGGMRLRQGLVVVQFAAAIVLLISVAVISRQLDFITEKDLGFETESILVIDSVPRDFTQGGLEQAQALRQHLSGVPGVKSASLSWRTAAESGDSRAVHPPERSPRDAISLAVATVDSRFAETFGLETAQGRFFSEGREADRDGIVLNETAARLFGWEDSIEGKSLVVWSGARANPEGDAPPSRPVIGVVEDYHFESLHNPIGPLAFVSVDAELSYRLMSLRLDSGDLQAGVERVRAAWEDRLPGVPFEYTFVDDQISSAYRTASRIRGLIGFAAGLTVLIACLGMLGLASISAVQRTKEAGIRKVMGATALQIVLLLSKDFLKPVAVAAVLALPMAYLLMRGWLEDFAYRVELSVPVFIATAAACLLVAFATVSVHAAKAARANPADSLRYE